MRDMRLSAALWLVRIYRGRGFDARETRRRLLAHMTQERELRHWPSSLYNVAAVYYEEAIRIEFGVDLPFPRAID